MGLLRLCRCGGAGDVRVMGFLGAGVLREMLCPHALLPLGRDLGWVQLLRKKPQPSWPELLQGFHCSEAGTAVILDRPVLELIILLLVPVILLISTSVKASVQSLQGGGGRHHFRHRFCSSLAARCTNALPSEEDADGVKAALGSVAVLMGNMLQWHRRGRLHLGLIWAFPLWLCSLVAGCSAGASLWKVLHVGLVAFIKNKTKTALFGGKLPAAWLRSRFLGG